MILNRFLSTVARRRCPTVYHVGERPDCKIEKKVTTPKIAKGFDQECGYFKELPSLTEAIKLIRLIMLLQIS